MSAHIERLFVATFLLITNARIVVPLLRNTPHNFIAVPYVWSLNNGEKTIGPYLLPNSAESAMSELNVLLAWSLNRSVCQMWNADCNPCLQ